jgi:outer membrane protein
MSRVKVLSVLAVFVLIGLVFSQGAEAASPMKIGYADYAAVFQGYDKTKEAYAVIREKSQKKQKEGESLIENVRNMKNELELLTDKQRDKKQVEIDEEIRKLQDFEREAKVDLDREKDNMEKEIFKEIEAVIEQYSIKNGYNLIISDRVLVYKQEKYDITREVLNLLNSKYRKASK